MQTDEREAAAALLLMVEQAYRDPVVPTELTDKEDHSRLMVGEASKRSSTTSPTCRFHDDLTEERPKRKPSFRQKLSKTARGEYDMGVLKFILLSISMIFFPFLDLSTLLMRSSGVRWYLSSFH